MNNVAYSLKQKIDDTLIRLFGLIRKGGLEEINQNSATLVLGENIKIPKVPRLESYGFTTFPPTSSTCVCFFHGGIGADTAIALSMSRESRPELSEGEVALYSAHKNSVTLRADGGISIESKGGGIQIKKGQDELIDLLSQVVDELQQLPSFFNAPGVCPTGAVTLQASHALASASAVKLAALGARIKAVGGIA